jgi:hypothetical protein
MVGFNFGLTETGCTYATDVEYTRTKDISMEKEGEEASLVQVGKMMELCDGLALLATLLASVGGIQWRFFHY